MIGRGMEKGGEGRTGCRESCLMLMGRCGESCLISQMCYMSKRERVKGKKEKDEKDLASFYIYLFPCVSGAIWPWFGISFLMFRNPGCSA